MQFSRDRIIPSHRGWITPRPFGEPWTAWCVEGVLAINYSNKQQRNREESKASSFLTTFQVAKKRLEIVHGHSCCSIVSREISHFMKKVHKTRSHLRSISFSSSRITFPLEKMNNGVGPFDLGSSRVATWNISRALLLFYCFKRDISFHEKSSQTRVPTWEVFHFLIKNNVPTWENE